VRLGAWLSGRWRVNPDSLILLDSGQEAQRTVYFIGRLAVRS